MSKVSKLQENFSMMWEYRELLWNLAHREINQRYKQSVLGYAWVILNPLFQLIVLDFVFSTVLKIPSQGVPFIIFLAVALLPWNLFATSLTSSVNALIANSSLITKIYFPREILVYSTIIAKIVDFLFSCIVLVVFFIFFKTIITPTLIWVPVIFAIQIIFTAGLSLILAGLNLFYRDIQYLLNLVIMLWMYLTPVMYPVEIIPDKYRFIFSLNPMSVIINAYRQTVLGGGQPSYSSLAIAFFMSVTVFAIGFYMFKKMEGEFADYV
ncbi:MAG: ABC transporter permease [Patescibacteria group bacterium]